MKTQQMKDRPMQINANLKQALENYFAAGFTFNLGINCDQIENYTCKDCEGNYSDCYLKEVQVSFVTMEDLENALTSFDSSRGNGFFNLNESFDLD